MKKFKLNLSAFMLMMAGVTLGFTACNEENEDVVNRKVNYKTLTSGNPYAVYEQNNYSAEKIFNMTAEFSRQLHQNSVSDMDIRQAVVVLETFWNYGVVAKQDDIGNAESPERHYQLHAPLTSSGQVDGSALRTNFINLLQQTVQQTNGQYLNIADVSVISKTNGEVIFDFYLPSVKQYPDMQLFEGPFKMQYVSLDSSMVYKNLPLTNVFFNSDTVSSYYAGADSVANILDVHETTLGKQYHLYATHVGGGAVDIKTLEVAFQVMTPQGNTLTISSTFNPSTEEFTYNTIDTMWAKNYYLPSLQKTLNDNISLEWLYAIIGFNDLAYKLSIKNSSGRKIGEEIRFVIRDIKIGKLISYADYVDLIKNITSKPLLDLTL